MHRTARGKRTESHGRIVARMAGSEGWLSDENDDHLTCREWEIEVGVVAELEESEDAELIDA